MIDNKTDGKGNTAAQTAQQSHYAQATMYVRVKATQAVEAEPGVFEITIPARQLTEAEHKMLQALFPHLNEQAHQLLAKEALLSAMED